MTDDKEHAQKIDKMCENVMSDLMPIGYMDLSTACKTFDEYGLTSRDLSEAVEDFMENVGVSLDKIDICYIALDYVLNHARNKIQEVTEFDFVNDLSNEINVHANFMCSQFDGQTEAQEEFKAKWDSFTDDQRTDILKDKVTENFLIEIEVIDEVAE